MRAFILDRDQDTVQIGNQIFHIKTGNVERSVANRRGLLDDSKCFVNVPMKSMDGAKLAIIMADRKQNSPYRRR
jgi:hypothetical protein